MATVNIDSIQTVFIGGGTPTILPKHEMLRLLNELKCLGISGGEISVEANPGTIDSDYLGILEQGGITRLSLGVQSFSDLDLKLLSRNYSKEHVSDIISNINESWKGRFSVDMMYGLQTQTVESWKHNLNQVISSNADHVSIYQLTIEDGTKFKEDWDRGRMHGVNDALYEELDDLIILGLVSKGFKRYEISNYAKPDSECRHNITYWKNESYLGVGAGAVGFVDNVRGWNEADYVKYMAKVSSGDSPIIKREQLTTEERFRETVVMGLRMCEGVSFARLQRRFEINVEEYYGETVARLEEYGLLSMASNRLRLTRKGMDIANTVMAELV